MKIIYYYSKNEWLSRIFDRVNILCIDNIGYCFYLTGEKLSCDVVHPEVWNMCT